MGEEEKKATTGAGTGKEAVFSGVELAFSLSMSAGCIADASGKLVRVNRAFLRMWGITEESKVLGVSLDDFLKAGGAGSSVLDVLKRQGAWEGEFNSEKLSGAPFRAFGQARAILNAGGDVTGFVASAQDVTERRRAEEAHNESEERFRVIFDGAPDAMFIADTKSGKILDANKAACRLLGRSRAEVLEMSQADLHPPKLREKAREIFMLHVGQTQFHRESPLDEISVLRKDGVEIPVEIRAQSVRLNKETVLMGTFRDISERRQAGEVFRKKEELIRNINNNLITGIVYQVQVMKNGARKVTYASDSTRRLYGVAPEKFIQDGTLPYSRVLDEDKPKLVELENQAIRACSVFKAEVRMLNPDGSIRWSSFTSHPTMLPDGTTRWDGIELDITDRKLAEEKLRRKEMLLTKAEEIANLGSWEFDLRSGTALWSDQTFRIFGVKPDEFAVTYQSFLDLIHPDDREKVDSAYRQSIEESRDSYQVEYRVIRRDSGEVRVVEDRCQHEKDGDGKVTRSIGIVLDITEKKHAEAARNVGK